MVKGLASIETVPAPAGQGAIRGAYRVYVTESQTQSAGMQGTVECRDDFLPRAGKLE